MKRLTPFLVLLFFYIPTPAESQTPGQRVPSRDRIRAEFLDNIREGIDDARNGWMETIGSDRIDDLMTHYTDGAMIIPPGGGPLYGTEAIRAYWEGVLPSLGEMRMGLGDLDASGQMAMIGGTYTTERVGANGGMVRESGGLLTVFVQAGRRWLIRAQVFAAPTAERPQ